MFDAIHSNSPEYGQVTTFVHEVFKRTYGANVRSFMSDFVRVRDRHGVMKAVMGYRSAESGPLYLENYLDEPIEVMVSRYMGIPVKRSEIVEVGNLAEASPGDARMAIIGATAFLHAAGFKWVAFTGVTRLRNAFVRLGLSPKQLIEVDERRLSAEEMEQWGSYYAGDPVVCFGSIQEGHDNLQELWTALRDTWAAAEIAGQSVAGLNPIHE